MLVRFAIKPSEAEIVALHSWKNFEIFLHSHKQTVKNLNSIFSCIFCVSEVAFSRHSIITVDYSIVMPKLHAIGLFKTALSWMLSYLTNCQQFVQ